jgi:6-phospho-beta-glucosidase
VKIAVIGGAGVRTPLLVSGLTASDLPIDEVALYDIDRERLDTIAPVARRLASRGDVAACDTLAACVDGADFVFTSIRVGGIERRMRDEAAAQRHGIIGQETVGPAGFAMAVRTIPHAVEYARAISAAAPNAWIVNFTNPVGMVTEAMLTATDRVVGICDTPTALFERAAAALEVGYERCAFDYFGLNHLGWLREVHFEGAPQLHRLWHRPEALRSIYEAPLFDPERLRELRLLPTEYVYFYEHHARAFEHVDRAGRTRGQVIAALTRTLFRELKQPGADIAAVYGAYLRARSAGYMTIEAGAADHAGVDASALSAGASRDHALSGYDKIAAAVVRAMHFDARDVIPLSVPNRGNLGDLDGSDVVEVPCVVGANGARPLHVGPIPDAVRPLLARVKAYERLTVRASLDRSLSGAAEALAANPLVPDRRAADRLIADLMPLW